MVTGDPELPAITVLLPVYNGERFLRQQVDSILAQRGVALRLIILDDGSTDNSFALATRLAEQDKRITIAERRPNAGLTSAVARLLRLVETPYFAMSDQDDIWDPDKLCRSIAALRNNDVKLTYSDVRLIDEGGTVIEESYWASRSIQPLTGTDLLPIIFCNPIIGHTIVASRDVAYALPAFPHDLIYYEVWLAAAAMRLGSVSYLDTQLGGYRTHTTNVVGPLSQRLSTRIYGKLKKPSSLRVRQQQRISALSALSEHRIEYKALSEFYSEGILGRLRHLSHFVQELRKSPALGFPTITKEALAHLVIGPGKGTSRET